MNNPTNYPLLLEVYQSLWNNRILLNEDNSEKTIRDTIKKDLLDEMTHPRVRKLPNDKFYLATKRVMDSTIEETQKLQLISLHIEELERIKNRNK
ncbi:hypothetical protein [Fredinandcohnia sp. 179-A 10B2 NHS]|uniref:hypothetical protein n=1 Tax=Fredinandcohnia sp. 179-A 10B2 NHS TaxID=3235176 RepID=UPI00399EFBDA